MGLKLLLLGLIGMGAVSGLQLNHEGSYPWYYYFEPSSGKCLTSNDCDGQRICKSGICNGIARPPKDANYRYDENTSTPPSSCNPNERYSEYRCDGNRKCSSNGYCQGTARWRISDKSRFIPYYSFFSLPIKLLFTSFRT